METINSENKPRLVLCLIQYQNWVANNIDAPVKKALRIQPAELTKFFVEIKKFTEGIQSQDTKTPIGSVGPIKLSYLKAAILYTLHSKSLDKELKSKRTDNRELLERLEDEVQEISELTEGDWFDNTTAFRAPKLTDFLTIEEAESFLESNRSLVFEQREFDDKFHVLNAASLILPDIHYYRSACNLRSKPLTVAYLDIDNFKQFNTDYGDLKVDRDLLPRFMSELEAHVFSHGQAYKFGGDEYVVLLPNMTSSKAGDFLAEFQKRLSEVDYFKIESRPTVSIGIIEIGEDSYQTDRESLTMAEQAKKEAKEKNKGSIFINKGSRTSENSFEEYEK